MATFDYTSRDFLSIRQDLLSRAAQLVPEWDTTDASDFGNVLVELWAYMGDIVHYYIDRAASETFLQTATQRESVMAIANLLDYIPASARASRGTVTFQLNAFPPSSPSSYTIPQYTVLTGYDESRNSYSFYTTAESNALTSTTVGAGGNQVTVSVVQGTIVQNEAVGSSDGSANQKFTLVKKNVDSDSIVVNVAEGPLSGGSPTNVQYQYVPQISTAGYLDKVFTARILSDGSTQIIFGNGFNGAIPTNNASITVTYRSTAGSAGNLPANKIVAISGTPSSYVSIVSSTTTYGGADTESLETIRTNVSRLYRTQDRAVSLQDYKDLTLQSPGVSKTTAVHSAGGTVNITSSINTGSYLEVTTAAPHNFVVGQTVSISGTNQATHNVSGLIVAMAPNSNLFHIRVSDFPATPTGTGVNGQATGLNQVILYPVPHQSSYPPAATSGSVVLPIPASMEEDVETYLADRSMLGVGAVVVTQDATIGGTRKYVQCTPVYVRLQVNVLDNYVQSWVREQVDAQIRSLLSFESVRFGQRLTMGEVYRAALSVPGVDYVTILNMADSYYAAGPNVRTSPAPADLVANGTKLLCFADDVGGNVAVTFWMVGGLTGSN